MSSQRFLSRHLTALSSFLAAFGTAQARADVATIIADRDAVVSSAASSLNFGSITSIHAGWDASNGVLPGYAPPAQLLRSYVHFDVFNDLPSGVSLSDITQATIVLRKTGTNNDPPQTFAINGATVNGSWTESGITYNNRPSTGSVLGTFNWTDQSFIRIPISVSVVANWFDSPSTNHGVEIASQGAEVAQKYIRIASRENTGFERPTLELTYTPSNQAPVLALTSPSSNITVTQGDIVTIAWSDSDPDDNAFISVARDSDCTDGGQTWISVSPREDPDGTGSCYPAGSGDCYTWDTTGVPPGTYRIWGMIYDGTNPQVYSCAPGSVMISEPFVVTNASIDIDPEDPVPVQPGATVTGFGSISGSGNGTVQYYWMVRKPGGVFVQASSLLSTSMTNGGASIPPFSGFPTTDIGQHKTWIRIQNPGGPNDSYSNEEFYTVVFDSGPRVTAHSPNGSVSGPVDHLDFTFNEPINGASFTIADVVDFNDGSQSIQPTGVSFVGGTTYRVSFPAMSAPATYMMTIGPDILDNAGYPMNQDEDTTNGESPQDRYAASFIIQAIPASLELQHYLLTNTSGTPHSANPGDPNIWNRSIQAGETIRFTLRARNLGPSPVSANWVLNLAPSYKHDYPPDQLPFNSDVNPNNNPESTIPNDGQWHFRSFDWTVTGLTPGGRYDLLASIRSGSDWNIVLETTEPGANTGGFGPNAWETNVAKMRFGITVITHGFSALGCDENWDWGVAMAKAVLQRAGLGQILYFYTNRHATIDPGDGTIEDRTLFYMGAGFAPFVSDQGEQVILLDWMCTSNNASPGYAEATAHQAYSFLRGGGPGWPQPLIDGYSRPLHLVGFSYGTVVISELAQRLGHLSNLEVEHVTYLDPHDWDEAGIPFDTTALMPDVHVWTNVDRCDNYFASNGGSLPCNPHGRLVSGARNYDLTQTQGFGDQTCGHSTHARVHVHYYGTIDTAALCEPPCPWCDFCNPVSQCLSDCYDRAIHEDWGWYEDPGRTWRGYAHARLGGYQHLDGWPEYPGDDLQDPPPSCPPGNAIQCNANGLPDINFDPPDAIFDGLFSEAIGELDSRAGYWDRPVVAIPTMGNSYAAKLSYGDDSLFETNLTLIPENTEWLDFDLWMEYAGAWGEMFHSK